MTQTIDSTATEEPTDAPSTDLVEVQAPAGHIVRADEPGEVIAKATAIATTLSDLIEKQGLSVNVGGKRKHVEVGGWQALGAVLGALGGQPLHAETVWTRKVLGPDGLPQRTTYTAHVKRYYSKNQGGGLREETTYDVDGFDWEAKVEIRTPDGTVVGSAEAMCARSEHTWGTRDDFALRSMAETRAESRAYRRAAGWIVNLAGYNATPAEEMSAQAAEVDIPAWAGPATAQQKKQMRAALAELLGSDEKAVAFGKASASEFGGQVPAAVALAISYLPSFVAAATTDTKDGDS